MVPYSNFEIFLVLTCTFTAVISGGTLYTLPVRIAILLSNSDLSMPNLISISRIKKFYENDRNLLLYVFVKYVSNNNVIQILEVNVKKLEQLNWECLTIGNLGKGQLQITNMNEISFQTFMTRTDWMERLSYDVVIYYQKLIDKIKTKWIKEWL